MLENIEFKTERLLVRNWKNDVHLSEAVMRILTPSVCESVPWDSITSIEEAKQWIDQRNKESAVCSILCNDVIVGFLILSEIGDEVKLGYLLGESYQSKGIGSELIQGLVSWCENQDSIKILSGGVDPNNIPSKKILTKNGFIESGSLPHGMIEMKKEIKKRE